MTRRGREVYHPRPTKLCVRSHLGPRPTAEKTYGTPHARVVVLLETEERTTSL